MINYLAKIHSLLIFSIAFYYSVISLFIEHNIPAVRYHLFFFFLQTHFINHETADNPKRMVCMKVKFRKLPILQYFPRIFVDCTNLSNPRVFIVYGQDLRFYHSNSTSTITMCSIYPIAMLETNGAKQL